MRHREQQVWDAAYAAAFVEEFTSSVRTRDAMGQPHPFDGAVAASSAERAIFIADLAVRRLREWRRDENGDAGEEVAER